jgi:hypothetical protein
MKRIAVMQPYVFPYIGYFQLIHSVETFVYYDDVNFIKQGWINRNRILVNGNAFLFTIPVENISSFKEIRHVRLHERNYQIWKPKFLKTLTQAYGQAPFFSDAIDLIYEALSYQGNTISELAQNTVNLASVYLGLNKTFLRSSELFGDSKGMDKADRLVTIAKRLLADNYVNPLGGTELYEKKYFSDRGIDLSFIKPAESIIYSQGKNPKFLPWLSIIDVIMFNSRETIQKLLASYELR